MSMAIAWPEKTTEMHNQHIDSTFWNGFKFRDDDIIISTYAKSGTTWMQQIISQMLFNALKDRYRLHRLCRPGSISACHPRRSNWPPWRHRRIAGL